MKILILLKKSQTLDPIDKAIQKYKFHPSILLIKSKVDKLTPFSFCKTTSLEIEKEIRDLNSNKATTHGNIPTKILKQSSEACKESLTNLFNKTIRESNFPKELKLADVTPIYKKDDPNTSKNYRPVSVLPVTSKIFERLLPKQLSLFENIYSGVKFNDEKGYEKLIHFEN